MKKLEDEFKALKEALEKEEKLRKETEENNAKLIKGMVLIFPNNLLILFYFIKKKMICIYNWNLNEQIQLELKNVLHV
jgi:hypothetical protein